jgi:hypothetical protein
MSRYFHESNGKKFEIDITPIPGRPGPLFVARIARIENHYRVRLTRSSTGRYEVYGPSESWALANARAVIRTGAWREEDIAIHA